jgi:hypothetical protein
MFHQKEANIFLSKTDRMKSDEKGFWKYQSKFSLLWNFVFEILIIKLNCSTLREFICCNPSFVKMSLLLLLWNVLWTVFPTNIKSFSYVLYFWHFSSDLMDVSLTLFEHVFLLLTESSYH